MTAPSNLVNGTASAPTSFRTLASDASMTVGFKATQSISRRIEKCIDSCCKHVASHCESCCEQHPTSAGLLLPPWHNTQATHVAIMLRLVLRVTSNIRSPPPPPPRHNTNITCRQHRNSTSARSKINTCNIEKIVDNELSRNRGKPHRNIYFMLAGTFK
jgi:hypothetical protein